MLYTLKCLKKSLMKKRILKLMKYENGLVQDSCRRRDWQKAEKYLHKSKATVKAFRRIQKLGK